MSTPTTPNMPLLLLNTFFAVVMAVAGLYAILKMSFGL